MRKDKEKKAIKARVWPLHGWFLMKTRRLEDSIATCWGRSQPNVRDGTLADPLRYFNGLLWHREHPRACFPTADCYAEVIRLDFQLTGNMWSVLLCALLEGKHWRAPAGAELPRLPEVCAQPNHNVNRVIWGSGCVCTRPKTNQVLTMQSNRPWGQQP